MKLLMLAAVLTLPGCACLQDKPALRTALIATGSAILGGAISHARDNDPVPVPTKHINDPKCLKKECW